MKFIRVRNLFTLLMSIFTSALTLTSSHAADPIFPKPVGIAFLGDSITESGANSPGGYVKLVVNGLEANGAKVTPFFAGISGTNPTTCLADLNAMC